MFSFLIIWLFVFALFLALTYPFFLTTFIVYIARHSERLCKPVLFIITVNQIINGFI